MAFSSMRQNKLHLEILEALELNEGKRFSSLETQWVHRYGLESLPSITNENLDLVALSITHGEQQEIPLVNEFVSDEKVNQENTEVSIFPELNNLSNELVLKTKENESAREEIEDDSTSLNDSFETNYTEHNINLVDRTTKDIETISPPPPRRTLKHLRRWLPDIEVDIPKAS